MKSIIFAHPKETLPSPTLLPNKLELFQKLKDRDLNPVITFNGETAFHDDGVETHDLVEEYTARRAGDVALHDVGAVVNRLDRVFRDEELPDSWQQAGIPRLNENDMRFLANRKHLMDTEVFEPLGLGIDTQLINSVDEAAVFLMNNPAEYYIVKPTGGTFSKGIERMKRSDVTTFFVEHPDLLGKVLIQPMYDFSIPVAGEIAPYDSESKSGFEAWAQSNVTKEFRMYGFSSPTGVDIFPVGRAMKDGDDHWFFVDPATVPDALYDHTKRVFSRAAQVTGSQAIYGALDIGYGSKSTSEAPDYHIVEFNARMPYLIGADKHAQVANVLRDKFADQLQQTANSERVE